MLGKKVADFESPATSGTTFRLSDHKGHPVVLYFYPKTTRPAARPKAWISATATDSS